MRLWQPFFDWVRAAPADYAVTDELVTGVHPARGWWDAQNRRSMNLDTRPGAPAEHGWWKGDQDQVGMYLHGYESLWLPASLLQADAQSRLADALFAASRHKEVGLHFNKGLAGAPAAAVSRGAGYGDEPGGHHRLRPGDHRRRRGAGLSGHARRRRAYRARPRSDAQAIDAATAELARVAPQGGSYLSESNYFNRTGSRPISAGTMRSLRP